MKTSLPRVLAAAILACPLSPTPAAGSRRGGGRGVLAREVSERVVIEQAVAEVVGPPPPSGTREMFAHHLRRRGEAVTAADKPKYWRELKARPELKDTPVYGADGPQSQAVLKVIKPILDLYGRVWDVAVIEQDEPFAGAFRQCIFIVSTGLLHLVTDEELRGFVAHELAHECFIEELREADRSHCASAYRLVEYKSDLVGALALLLACGDPLALATGVEKVEAYYLRSNPSVLRDDTHPDSTHRRRCIELFLTRIKEAGVLTLGIHYFEGASAIGWLRPDYSSLPDRLESSRPIN